MYGSQPSKQFMVFIITFLLLSITMITFFTPRLQSEGGLPSLIDQNDGFYYSDTFSEISRKVCSNSSLFWAIQCIWQSQASPQILELQILEPGPRVCQAIRCCSGWLPSIWQPRGDARLAPCRRSMRSVTRFIPRWLAGGG